MRGRLRRHGVAPSFQPLNEQRVVPIQFNGWHGLLVPDFPEFSPAWEEILFELSRREIALIPIAEYGTLLVFLTRDDDLSHEPLSNLTAQAVLFTSDPLERRTVRVTASDAWGAFEQICAYFSLSLRSDEEEQCSPLTSSAQEGLLHGNVSYRLPGWTGRCTIFFPTGEDRAIMALMAYSGEGAQYSARIVRFSPDNSRCNQVVMQAPTPEGMIARTLYRYRLGTIARTFLHRALRWSLPSWVSAPLRWVGGAIGILSAILFQLATVVVILVMLNVQDPRILASQRPSFHSLGFSVLPSCFFPSTVPAWSPARHFTGANGCNARLSGPSCSASTAPFSTPPSPADTCGTPRSPSWRAFSCG